MHWIALPLPLWASDTRAAPAHAHAAAHLSSLVHTEAVGWWALRFTPRVVWMDGEAVLLEVSTTERLWGGRDHLLEQVLAAWTVAADATCAAQPDVRHLAPAAMAAMTRTANQTHAADAAHSASTAHTTPTTSAKPTTHLAHTVCGTGPTALLALAYLRLHAAGRAAPLQPHGLPLHTLTALRPHIASLERMGCRTLGALQALPRAGVARRFGAVVLQVLDQALGHVPEVHRWLKLPEQFELTAELPALAESADALLWSAHRCLSVLHSWLQARQQGVLALELSWRHDLRRIDGVHLAPTQALLVRTAQATQDITHLRRLLAENLARTQLAAPVNQITLRLLESALFPHRSDSLLPPDDCQNEQGQGEALHQLLERLSARLGVDQVQAPVLLADHRPECMQQWQPATQVLTAASIRPLHRPPHHPHHTLHRGGAASLTVPHTPEAALWPTWLLSPPRRLAMQGHRPCHHGLLRLLAGPHRLEAGWWPCAATTAATATAAYANHPSNNSAPPGLALRDYFVAHNAVAGLVWVFRERLAPQRGDGAAAAQPHRWFLHGVFG